MQVRITFNRPADKEDEDLIHLFMTVAIEEIDDLLFRTPDYVVRGRHKQTLTFYGLSSRETDTIYNLISKEIIPDGFISRVVRIRSKGEEDTGPFMFAAPEYKEGMKEHIESRRGYQLDTSKIVSIALKVATNRLYDEIGHSETPLTTKAYARGLMLGVFEPACDDELLIDYMTKRIANEPMYKERPRRKRTPRARVRRTPRD